MLFQKRIYAEAFFTQPHQRVASCLVEGGSGEDLAVIGLCALPCMEPQGEPLAHPASIWAQARGLCSPPSLAAAFCLCSTSGPKPKRRNGKNCIMVLVVTYLVLLTVGAGLLVIQGKAPESCLVLPWVTTWTHQIQNLGSGESPGATAAHLLGESSQALGGQGGAGRGGESRKGSVCYVLHVCVCVCVYVRWAGEREARRNRPHMCVSEAVKEAVISHWYALCISHQEFPVSGWKELFIKFILIGG